MTIATGAAVAIGARRLHAFSLRGGNVNSLLGNSHPKRLFGVILAVCNDVGYRGDLVERDYTYPDRLALGQPDRRIDAALFGRTPASYETALFGVVEANGVRGHDLVNSHRSLGAPILLEVQDEEVRIWAVGRDESSNRLEVRLDEVGFKNWVSSHLEDIRPLTYLRTKEFSGRAVFLQESLFAGLIPELEIKISSYIEPILEQAFAAGIDTYKSVMGSPPPEPDLFKLTFWLLTGKVFADRGHPRFLDLRRTSDPDEILSRVAEHYGERVGGLLDSQTRDAVFGRIWTRMDFRHLSVEVLSQIWSRTLVTPETRKRLGIHRTRRSIVRYLVEKVPFEDFPPEERRVLEPCAGSVSFLIGAMDRMREISQIDDPIARHAYFQRMLVGIEKDPFGVEIGRLCLALADYPNHNNWQIIPSDVFDRNLIYKPISELLNESRIVLCNPPFEKFTPEERVVYGPKSLFKPAELLGRVLDHIHPQGVIGFVMPRAFLDGQDYREVRSRLIRRFGQIDLVSLPDKAWDVVNPETVLLTAADPRSGERSAVTHAVVTGQDWEAFDWSHQVRSRDTSFVTAQEARDRLAVPELRAVWDYLAYGPMLGEIAEPHRGIEWRVPQRTHRDTLVRDEQFPESRRGVPPRAKISSFQHPTIKYLNFSEEHRKYSAFDLPWDKPKVIIGKTRRSRGMWRVAAFADFDGLACYETFIAIWPNNPDWTVPLEAVLNGPVANAFLALHNRESFSHDTIKSVPFPILGGGQIAEINRLVEKYRSAVEAEHRHGTDWGTVADGLLRELDAVILEGYGLPPQLERQLLDAFNGGRRQVPFEFGTYFPPNFTPYFTLKEWLTEKPNLSTVERFRSQGRGIPDHILLALELACDLGEDGAE